MEKRGMSGVVTTLVIILVSLVAIGILWVVVSAIIKANTRDVSTTIGGLTTDLEITTAREQGVNIFASIMKKSGDQEIGKVMFILSNSTNDEQITLNVNGQWNKLSTQSFTITPVEFTSAQVETISIVPIYVSGGDETTGEVADIFTVLHGTEEGGEGGGGELPGCTPNCAGMVCGADDGCGGLCDQETCDEGQTCEEGVCVVGEVCVPEDASITCGTWVCGSRTNNCDNLVLCPAGGDGECAAGELCDTQNGVCNLITPLNNGTTQNVYPAEGEAYLFGSSDLLNVEEGTSYIGKWIQFPDNLEIVTLCNQLTYHIYEEGYAMAIVGFSFRKPIVSNERYYIFNTQDECLNYVVPV